MSDFNVPEGVIYKGPMGIARDSVWLTAEDLPHDRDTVVTIESVLRRDNVTFEGGRVKKITLALKFVGKERQYLTNATARHVLEALFGPGAEPLYGKRIALYVKQGVPRPGQKGVTGPAIRIRPKHVDPKQAAPARQPGEESIEPETVETTTEGNATP